MLFTKRCERYKKGCLRKSRSKRSFTWTPGHPVSETGWRHRPETARPPAVSRPPSLPRRPLPAVRVSLSAESPASVLAAHDGHHLGVEGVLQRPRRPVRPPLGHVRDAGLENGEPVHETLDLGGVAEVGAAQARLQDALGLLDARVVPRVVQV